jgi:asparagine N-glycosylation enzyme membrane subunit Stt3
MALSFVLFDPVCNRIRSPEACVTPFLFPLVVIGGILTLTALLLVVAAWRRASIWPRLLIATANGVLALFGLQAFLETARREVPEGYFPGWIFVLPPALMFVSGALLELVALARPKAP